MCSDITAAWTKAVMPAARCLPPIDRDEPIDADRLNAAGPFFDALIDACVLIPLWGPDHLMEAAKKLRVATADFMMALTEWNDILGNGDQDAIDAHKRHCMTLRDEFSITHRTFVQATRGLLTGSS